MEKKPNKRIKFKVVEPKTKPKPKMDEKKKKIKFVVKKKEEPKPQPKKKKIKFVVKNTADKKLDALKKKVEEQSKKDGIKRRVLPTGEVQRKKTKPKPSELQRVAGVKKDQANIMDSAELFGKLPVELRLKILNPKETGIKVAREKLTPQQLIELDDIVDDLIGCEFYYKTFANLDFIFSNKKKYMNKQEDRVLKYGKQTASAQDKLFSGELLKILEIMDKKNMLNGYDNLNRSFHNNDLDQTIGEIAMDREDYWLADHLGVDKRDDDGLFIATSRTRNALKEYIDEYEELKNKTIDKMKDFKL
jgi:hypothetical protein